MVGVSNETHCLSIGKITSTIGRKDCQNNLSKDKWSQQKGNVPTWGYDFIEILTI